MRKIFLYILFEALWNGDFWLMIALLKVVDLLSRLKFRLKILLAAKLHGDLKKHLQAALEKTNGPLANTMIVSLCFFLLLSSLEE